MNLIELGQLTEEEARTYLETIIWVDQTVCPFCGSTKHYTFKG
ncbi:MAG: transposase, partial [Caldisericia bacterium]|nr:transposase [Caldisericia bacterium]